MMYVSFYEKETLEKGIGIFAKEYIPQGAVIWRLTEGKRFTKEEYTKLLHTIKKDTYPEGDHYVQAVGNGESWNHSCDANTWWTADNELSARRDILPDEELTYDYATTDIDPRISYTWECRCGTRHCRKTLHWNDILIPTVYATYRGHLPSWVEQFVTSQQHT